MTKELVEKIKELEEGDEVTVKFRDREVPVTVEDSIYEEDAGPWKEGLNLWKASARPSEPFECLGNSVDLVKLYTQGEIPFLNLYFYDQERLEYNEVRPKLQEIERTGSNQ